MPVVADRTIENPSHRLKAVDLTELPADLPSGPVLYELDNGRLVVNASPNEDRGAIDFKLSASLVFEGERRGFGKALVGDVGLILWRDPDRVVIVDAVFICKSRLPVKRAPEGFLECGPDLVAEVRGPDDSLAYLQKKIDDLHKAGVRVVLLIDPIERCIVESRSDKPQTRLEPGDILTIPDVIPGYEVDVADLFER